jgi:hypothetical protein
MSESLDAQPRRLRSRFLLEGVVIVFSILLAFAIDAGWDEWQERRAETEILQALEADLESYQVRFSRRAEFYAEMSQDIVWFLDEALFEPAEIERLDRAMLAFVGVPTMETGSGVHVELVASGRVSLISNAELRRRVSTWEALLGETTDGEVVAREYATVVVVPYLASRRVPIGRGSRIPWQPGWELAVASEREALVAYRALAADPEFRALAAWRYEWALGSSRGFERASMAADSALTLVRAGLRRGG